MLKEVFIYWVTQLGEGSGLTFYVNCAVALVFFLGVSILWVIYICSRAFIDDPEWAFRPIPDKVAAITRGILALTFIGYIIYLLTAWSTWTIMMLEAVGVFALMAPIITVSLLTIAGLCGYVCIYESIKKMVSYFK